MTLDDGVITFHNELGYQVIIGGTFTGEIYVECNETSCTYVNINGTEYTFDVDGAVFGFITGEVWTNKIVALHGFKLTQDMPISGITLSDVTDTTAKATIVDQSTEIMCYAVGLEYKIFIDGVDKGSFQYGKGVEITGLDATALYDKNGATVGIITNGTWYYGRDSGNTDLELTSVKNEAWAGTVKTKDVGTNVSTKSAISFEGVDGNVVFELSSGVRFDFKSSIGGTYYLTAQKTTYNGKDAFLVKAENDVGTGKTSVYTSLYIPVSGEGQRVIHVDEYGRINQMEGTLVKINDQFYMKVNAFDYSIFYAESDSPRHDVPGGNGNNVMLFVGIGIAAAAIIAIGAYFIMRKH